MVLPPRILNPPAVGISKVSGAPATRNARSGRPIRMPKPARKIGKIWPVFIWRLLAHFASAITAMIATGMEIAKIAAPSPQTGLGMERPRLLRKMPNGRS
ncbi:hypothetical protein D3C80_1779390 [compost metagenome]